LHTIRRKQSLGRRRERSITYHPLISKSLLGRETGQKIGTGGKIRGGKRVKGQGGHRFTKEQTISLWESEISPRIGSGRGEKPLKQNNLEKKNGVNGVKRKDLSKGGRNRAGLHSKAGSWRGRFSDREAEGEGAIYGILETSEGHSCWSTTTITPAGKIQQREAIGVLIGLTGGGGRNSAATRTRRGSGG